jgi:GNAT superfamily N-acetyltransferase
MRVPFNDTGEYPLAEISYETATQVPDTVRDTLYDELRRFNQASNQEFWARCEDPATEARPLIVTAYDDAGQVLAGLFGETRFAWLKISIMAVQEDLRGRGLGRELVQRAEAEARLRGCRYAFVDTMSYQAPEFYQRLGYAVAGRIEDWDSHSHAKFFLTKTL